MVQKHFLCVEISILRFKMDQKRSTLKRSLIRIGQDDQGGSTGSDGLDRSDESQ